MKVQKFLIIPAFTDNVLCVVSIRRQFWNYDFLGGISAQCKESNNKGQYKNTDVQKFLKQDLILTFEWGPGQYVRGSFEKFVDSRHYFEPELCGGAVTVSFSKYLPWQAVHFLQRSTPFSKTCCRPFGASFRRIVEQAVSCLGAPTSWMEKPRNRMGTRSGLYGGCSNEVPAMSVERIHCHFSRMWSDIVLKVAPPF
jgi:hypothetical protein